MATTVKRVLVTGANKGIGYAICSALLKRHPDTFVFLDPRISIWAEAAVAQLISEGGESWKGRVKAVAIDVADPASVQRAAEEVAAACGGASSPPPLYGVVNNAGLGSSDLRTVLETNLCGVKNVVDAFLPLIQPQGGRSVNVSSGSAPSFVAKCTPECIQRLFVNPAVTWGEIAALAEKVLHAASTSPAALEQLCATEGLSPTANKEELLGYDISGYGLSKALLNSYTIALARDHPGLVVNGCSPGFVATDLTQVFAERAGKTPAEMGMKIPEEGASVPIKLLMEELGPESRGWFYGSDG